MAAVEFLARDFTFSINTGTTLSPTWTAIGGLNTWGWKEDATDKEATDFNDNGWGSSLITARRATCSLKGSALLDTVAGTKDAGQAAVEASARLMGSAGVKEYKIEANGVDDSAITFSASAKLAETGDKHDDLLPWGAELMINGEPEFTGIFGG